MDVKDMAKLGGKARWAGKSEAERKLHGKAMAEAKKLKAREADGKYAFTGNWDRICVCGHKLGIHAGENDTSKRPCFNEDSGIEDATGEYCPCPHFRPSRSKKLSTVPPVHGKGK